MEPPAKKQMLEEKEVEAGQANLDGFNIIKVLLNDSKSKRVHVHGKIYFNEPMAHIEICANSAKKHFIDIIKCSILLIYQN